MNMLPGKFIITFFLVLQVFVLPARNQTGNTLQEHGIQWESLHTSHFVIHYPRDHYSAAMRIALVSEELYPSVCQSLNSYPEVTNIVVRSRIDYPTGFTVNIPWRIEISLTEPSGDEFKLNDSWLRVLLTHEFTHIAHMRKSRRLTKLAGIITGEYGSILQQLVPNWFTEGLATYNETRFTAGGRGRSEAFTMLLKGSLLGHPSWTVNNINYSSRKRKPTGNMMYVSGNRIVEFLDQTAGADVLTRIMDDYTSNPILGLYRVIEQHTGLDREELYHAAMHSSAQSDRKLIPDADYNIRAAIDPLDDMSIPRWINDRQLSYYRKGVADPQEINLLDPDGTHTTIVRTKLTDRNNSLTLNDSILITAELFTDPFYGTQIISDLVRYDLQEGRKVRLTKGQRLFSPDLSKKGRNLIAVQNIENQTRIVQVNAETGEIKPLILIKDTFLSNPSQSPDSNKIAYVLRDREGKQNIAIFSRKTRQWTYPYQPNDHHDNFPAWTPDSRHVLYSTDGAGVFNIWAVELESGKQWQVTKTSLGAFSPQVSPNGKRLAVKVYTPDGYRIATTAFDPSLWKPINPNLSKASSGNVSDEEQYAKIGIVSQDFPRKHYRGFRSALIPNSWMPLIFLDEDNSVVAMYFNGADPLQFHEFLGIIGIYRNTSYPYYDIAYSYKKSWPGIGLRITKNSYQVDHTDSDDRWQPDRYEIRLNFPLTIDTNVNRSYINGNVIYKYQRNERFGHSQIQEILSNESIQLVSSYGNYIQAAKDIVPRLGIFITGQVEIPMGIFEQRVEKSQRIGEILVYLPSILKHHSISILLNAHKRDGIAKYYNSAATPYGHLHLPLENLVRLQLRYIFPVAYIEESFWINPIYMNILSASIFLDAGEGWVKSGNHFDHSRRSYGLDLNITGFLFYRFPFKAGLDVLFLGDNKGPTLNPYIRIGIF
ncbi:MAG: hypothetical protein V3U16_01260 [Candidatus Neomarinimicrobiota bacterium]